VGGADTKEITFISSGGKRTSRVVKKPFKDVFNGIVYLQPQPGDIGSDAEPSQYTWQNRHFSLRIVEAIRGTWLSKITSWIYDQPLKAYDPTVIFILTEEHAEWFARHASVHQTPMLNYYQRGDIPSGYDEWVFDPDKIYPGQRFFLLEPIESIHYEPPTPKPKKQTYPSFWDGVWVGLGEGHSGDFFVIGAHDMNSILYNIGDGYHGKTIRNVKIHIHGYKFGPGLGGSVSAVLVMAWGYDRASEINGVTGGWDFDIALVSKLSSWLKSLGSIKNLDKMIEAYEEFKKLRWAAEQVVKNRGVMKPGVYTIPIPAAGAGAHLWGGYKFGDVEVISTGTEIF